MEFIKFLGGAFVLIFISVLVDRLCAALEAGKCAKCGSRKTGIEVNKQPDDHDPHGTWESKYCKCYKCKHLWEHNSKPVFIPSQSVRTK